MSDSAKLLVVLGATGAQGGAVLRYLAQNRNDFELRGVSRDPTSPSSQALESIGVQMVKADVKDESSLHRAFQGATHIFANIDSVGLIMESMQQPELLEPGQSPFERGAELEKLCASNLISAAQACNTLQSIIWSSLPSASRGSGGKYTRVTHFDAKEQVAEMFQANHILRPKLSLLFFGLYFDMPLRLPPLYPISKKQDGVYELSLALTGDERLPFANVELDAGGWAAALFDAKPGIKLIGCSHLLSWKEWLQKWAAQNVVRARYSQCSAETQAAYFGGAGASTYEAMKFVAEYGMAGGDPDAVLPSDIGAPTTTVAEAMSREDWSSILS